MSQKPNATCSICGKPYVLCKTCENIQTYAAWRNVADSLNCYKIFIGVHEYSVLGNKEQAKDYLEKCDLKELDTFEPNIKNVINEILGKKEETKTTQKITYEAVRNNKSKEKKN